MKWWTIRHEPEGFDFRGGDDIVRFAQAHGMKVRGHCLVWDHDNPKWLANGQFMPPQLARMMQEHISTVMKHYAGQVFAWDVVNEALDENGKYKDSIWYNQPGIGMAGKDSAYVEQAFRWAHEADPKALLFYNENGAEGAGKKSDAVYAMVKGFKERGVPIDGVGLQLHIERLDYDSEPVRANIARLTALGLQVHITELDVSLPLDAQERPRRMIWSDRRRFIEASRMRVCETRGARAFRRGDSRINGHGSDRTRMAGAEQHCCSIARISQSLLTVRCWRRFRRKRGTCISEAGAPGETGIPSAVHASIMTCA